MKKSKKEMKKVNSKSQTWSIDILIAVSIFIVALIVLFYFLNTPSDQEYSNLQKESDSLPGSIISSESSSATDITFVVGNEVDRERLKNFTSKNYTQIKNELGLSGEFCIHFEDEEGRLVDINESPEGVQYTIGSPELVLTVEDETGNVRHITCGS